MRIECSTQALSEYRDALKRFVTDECARFKRLKRKCESADWDDRVYTAAMTELNAACAAIGDAIDEVDALIGFLDRLLARAETYVETKSGFCIR